MSNVIGEIDLMSVNKMNDPRTKRDVPCSKVLYRVRRTIDSVRSRTYVRKSESFPSRGCNECIHEEERVCEGDAPRANE